jgi:hypothetical protein
LASLLPLTGCNPVKTYDLSKDATAEFHRLLAAGADDAIYDAAYGGFKSASSREAVHAYFSLIRTKMGRCNESHLRSIVLSATSHRTLVTAKYGWSCQNGVLEEIFIWQIVDGGAKLQRYSAISPLLVKD